MTFSKKIGSGSEDWFYELKSKSKNININLNDLNSINNIDGNTQSQYGIGESDINRNWYDGRYLYTFSPTSLKTIYPWTTYNLLYPFFYIYLIFLDLMKSSILD